MVCDREVHLYWPPSKRLNPYSIGIWSATVFEEITKEEFES